jgi:hypothetical protein
MIAVNTSSGFQKTTSYKVVIPFYGFAALSFLIACVLLLAHTEIWQQHHFNPKTLAITHLMALGWGTMIILGASHQLLPVIIEGKLDSELLAYLSFGCAAVGIPLLVTGFYYFHTGLLLQSGAVLVNAAVVFYLVNVTSSIYENKKLDVYALFMLTASIWLFVTTFFGLMLVFNFTRTWLPANSLEYLSLHAHLGLAGWFLLMVLGVGSKLIPMFLISKYSNTKKLWCIYALINGSLFAFIGGKIFQLPSYFYAVPISGILLAVLLFSQYCYKAYVQRIRKKTDQQMKISLVSVAFILLPLIIIIATLGFLRSASSIVLLYGFTIFFGWLTAIIFGMTFKTLPFIVWHKIYHNTASSKTPLPKDLFSENLFTWMAVCYLAGFLLFATGIALSNILLLQAGALSLLVSAFFYAGNVTKTILHKPVSYGSNQQ